MFDFVNIHSRSHLLLNQATAMALNTPPNRLIKFVKSVSESWLRSELRLIVDNVPIKKYMVFIFQCCLK